MKKAVWALILIYLLSYGLFRTVRSEVWPEDNTTYVIYPTNPLAFYYVYRPLAYVDGLFTGIGSHIGPHQ